MLFHVERGACWAVMPDPSGSRGGTVGRPRHRARHVSSGSRALWLSGADDGGRPKGNVQPHDARAAPNRTNSDRRLDNSLCGRHLGVLLFHVERTYANCHCAPRDAACAAPIEGRNVHHAKPECEP